MHRIVPFHHGTGKGTHHRWSGSGGRGGSTPDFKLTRRTLCGDVRVFCAKPGEAPDGAAVKLGGWGQRLRCPQNDALESRPHEQALGASRSGLHLW